VREPVALLEWLVNGCVCTPALTLVLVPSGEETIDAGDRFQLAALLAGHDAVHMTGAQWRALACAAEHEILCN
jgi:hypothetical protein